METIHQLEESFGSEFMSIYNQYQSIYMYNRSYKRMKSQNVKFFLHFYGKKWLFMVKFSQFCSESFHRDNDRCVAFIFSKTWPMDNRCNCALLTWQKNFAWLSSCCYCTDRAQNVPQPAPDKLFTVLQICNFGGVIAECINTAKMRHKVNLVFDWSLSSSRINTSPTGDTDPQATHFQSVLFHLKKSKKLLPYLCIYPRL